jgi:acetyltransferase
MSAATTSPDKVHALINPRNVVIVGASDRPGNWAQRAARNLRQYGFAGEIYPFNPTRDEIWGERCYRSFADLPEPPDHLLVVVPAKFVAATLRDGAKAGARSANILSSGFDEVPGEEGAALARELAAAIAETGLAVCGPNCMGNFNSASSFFTLTDDRPHNFIEGPVALFGQSGGIVMAIKRGLEERGLVASAFVTSGNETGLNSADYIDYFAQQPHIKVLVCYLESIRKPEAFLEACRRAREAGKAVVVMKLGASSEGREAAAAHTGALAGALDAFDAVAGAAGALRVRNLDDLVETVEYLAHAPLPKGDRIAAMTFSGGFRGLLLDCAELNQMKFRPLSDHTRDRLDKLLGVGTILGNPLDAGFTALSSNKAYLDCVQTLVDDPDIDIVLLQEEVPRWPGSERKEENLRAVNELAPKAGKPIVFISMISYGQNDYSRTLRAKLPNLTFLQEPDRILRTMKTITDYVKQSGSQLSISRSPNTEARKLLESFAARSEHATLDEVASKHILRLYGIPTPREEMARTADEAVAAAGRIGFPIVAKVVSAALPHKSDIGGVIVGLTNGEEVRAAFARIETAVAGAPGKPRMEGVLIAEMQRGDLECVLGAARDPEVGHVILFGSGGVDLELTRDTALAAPGLDREAALGLIDRTRAGRLTQGYRGKPALDRNTLANALAGLSHLIEDCGDLIESVDINPFLLRENGGAALDGLIVLRRHK